MTCEYVNIHRLAVISDTHGHLSPPLLRALTDADLIIHAGDMDRPDIWEKLNTIAPVLAVRGNMDRGDWADNILPSEMVSIEGMFFYIIHDILKLDIDPDAIGVKVVISGHTHRPMIEKTKDVTYLNPGSASQPRGGFLPSFAQVTLNHGQLEIQIKNIRTSI